MIKYDIKGFKKEFAPDLITSAFLEKIGINKGLYYSHTHLKEISDKTYNKLVNVYSKTKVDSFLR